MPPLKRARDALDPGSAISPRSLSSRLVDGVEESNYRKWGRPDIRAQLLDITKRKLEMDFVLEGDHRSMHVLDAVSPAFTCSLPFAGYVCDHIDNAIR